MLTNKDTLPAKEYGSGWDMVVDRLLSQLDALPGTVEVVQRKEKFGGLRVYVNAADVETSVAVNVLIKRAESLCETICDVCGSVGRTRSERGWHRTRCDYCDQSTTAGANRGPLDAVVSGLTDAVYAWAVAEVAHLENWQARYGEEANEVLAADQRARLMQMRELTARYGNELSSG